MHEQDTGCALGSSTRRVDPLARLVLATWLRYCPSRRLTPQESGTFMLSVGSLWHRWDPHLHTPDTLFANNYGAGWDGFLTAIETASPVAEALGITEYCSIEGYKEFAKYHAAGRAPGVRFFFPNVEFRLDLQTEKKRGVNIHLLFSPEDADHVRQIERALGLITYEHKGRHFSCSIAGLQDLGRAFDTRITDESKQLAKGAEQFKLTMPALRAFLRDPWARKKCLVAVAGGSHDGTAGLQQDSAFAAEREEIEAIADIIFDANQKSRDFWSGRGGLNEAGIESKYRSLKPCMHGSDAHTEADVLAPDLQRYCWVRADLTFTGLKQTLLEPTLRVHIGAEPPTWAAPEETIQAVTTAGAPWLATPHVPLNPGLVAVIGPKGSGKTALADLIAAAAGADVSDPGCFLQKAAEYLDVEKAGLAWRDGTYTTPVSLSAAARGSTLLTRPRVRYLSQQFVDRLCAAQGVTDELVAEVENVVFQAMPGADHLGAADFDGLRAIKVEQVVELRRGRVEQIAHLSRAIAVEDEKKAATPALIAELNRCEEQVTKGEKALADLLPKDKALEIGRFQALQKACEDRENGIAAVSLALAHAAGLYESLGDLTSRWQREFREVTTRFARVGLTDQEWDRLRPVVSTPASDVIGPAETRLRAALRDLQSGSAQVGAAALTPEGIQAATSHAELKRQLDLLGKEIGVERERARRHRELQANLVQWKRNVAAAQLRLADARQADARRSVALGERRDVYASVFDLLAREQVVLEELYSPLQKQLAAETASKRKLEFYVRRNVDLAGWAARGESLLDLRRNGPFQGRGALFEAAREQLLAAWRVGDAATVADAMEGFIERYAVSLVAAKKLEPEVSLRDLGEWLFSTDHISLSYAIRYDTVDLAKLSPGMRGIVLLILYLAVDQWDTRPLVVDQPEENLDPQSIYDELRGYFRDAKKRRQVILVTHNANLVVNTDADQVIVAESVRETPAGLPRISYTSGALEDADIRSSVCRILEGGERAFRERERRYALPRDPRVGV